LLGSKATELRKYSRMYANGDELFGFSGFWAAYAMSPAKLFAS